MKAQHFAAALVHYGLGKTLFSYHGPGMAPQRIPLLKLELQAF
jgi:hypothetical protein